MPGILNWQNRLWKIVKTFTDYRNGVSLKNFQEEPTDPKFTEHDAYMFDSRNYFLKIVTFNIIKTQQLSIAISRMQGLTNRYILYFFVILRVIIISEILINIELLIFNIKFL